MPKFMMKFPMVEAQHKRSGNIGVMFSWSLNGSMSCPALVSFAHAFKLLRFQQPLRFHSAAQRAEEPFVVVSTEGVRRSSGKVPDFGIAIPDFVRQIYQFPDFIVGCEKFHVLS